VVVVSATEQHHEMVRQAVDESGLQAWLCPECGRRLLLSWPPNYRKIVLQRGDVWTPHVGGTGGLRTGHLGVPLSAHHAWTEDDERAFRELSRTEGDGPTS
jgi:hypothetical protein